MPEPIYPWYIDWFRSPDRWCGVAIRPAVLNIMVTVALVVAMRLWLFSFIGLGLHLVLWRETRCIRERYGVASPTTAELQRLATDGDEAARRELARRRVDVTRRI